MTLSIEAIVPAALATFAVGFFVYLYTESRPRNHVEAPPRRCQMAWFSIGERTTVRCALPVHRDSDFCAAHRAELAAHHTDRGVP